MDCKFKNDAHINKICSTSFLYLWNIIKVQHLMDNKTAQVVVQALVLSRMDYCNLLLMGSGELSNWQVPENSEHGLWDNLQSYKFW